MATLYETILFSIIQGLTEWLPVSSSGHFALAQRIMNTRVPVFVDVFLHAGTLLSVIVVYRQDVVAVVKAIARWDFRSPGGQLAVNILVGGLPTAIIGLLLHDVIEGLFTNLLVVGIGLAITGLCLYLSKTKTGKKSLSLQRSAVIGLAQGMAAIPGLSRSGLTISVGVLLGVEREQAFTYSFLLSIPTILGATLLNAKNMGEYQVDGALLLVGFGISAFLGYVSLKIVRHIYRRKDGFTMFAPYCWLLGFSVMMAVLIMQMG